jgi:hypothetical protein
MWMTECCYIQCWRREYFLEAKRFNYSVAVSAALAVLLAACAWYYDAKLIAMLCVVAVMWQLARLLYYLVRWNRSGLVAGGIRLLFWVAATASAMTALDYYGKLTRERGDALVTALQAHRAREGVYPKELEALVPRYIAAIPAAALWPSREQKFKYRLSENNFRLMYVSGFRMASEYDSETSKWEELD